MILCFLENVLITGGTCGTEKLWRYFEFLHWYLLCATSVLLIIIIIFTFFFFYPSLFWQTLGAYHIKTVPDAHRAHECTLRRGQEPASVLWYDDADRNILPVSNALQNIWHSDKSQQERRITLNQFSFKTSMSSLKKKKNTTGWLGVQIEISLSILDKCNISTSTHSFHNEQQMPQWHHGVRERADLVIHAVE